MGIRVITGPPFSGKSQKVAAARRPGDVLFDTTALWRAFKDPEQTERSEEDARIAMAMMRRGLEVAVEQGRDGWVIVAMRAIAKLKKWLDAADADRAILVSAPWKELEKRAKARGPSCEAILDKWSGYEDDADLREVTDPWEDEMRSMMEFATQYRAACESIAFREVGMLVQHRCLTEDAELRAEDTDGGRVVTGVAIRYDDEAMVWGMRERIVRGALELPKGMANLTLQHLREMPLGLLEFQEDDDALRFRTVLTEGPRQDQALLDVRNKLVRGASLEFIPTETKEVGQASDPVMEVKKGRVLRLSLVDDGAYPQSKIEMAKPEKMGDMPKDRAKSRCACGKFLPRESDGEHCPKCRDKAEAKPKRRAADRRFLVAC